MVGGRIVEMGRSGWGARGGECGGGGVREGVGGRAERRERGRERERT